MKGLKYDDKYLILFWYKLQYFNSNYIYPAQLKLLTWLRNQGGLAMHIRTLNRHLRELEKRQLIGRIRRVKHDVHKGLTFKTTLYSIGSLGLIRLVQIGVITYKEMRAFIKKSLPFGARRTKKEKKGITPGDPGFYKDFTTYGSPQREPI